jgi:hypothetical protein
MLKGFSIINHSLWGIPTQKNTVTAKAAAKITLKIPATDAAQSDGGEEDLETFVGYLSTQRQ